MPKRTLYFRNAVCIIEHAQNMPVLRHWADGGGRLSHYGGLAGSVLVVRAIYTVYNYDYIVVSDCHCFTRPHSL